MKDEMRFELTENTEQMKEFIDHMPAPLLEGLAESLQEMTSCIIAAKRLIKRRQLDIAARKAWQEARMDDDGVTLQ